MLAVRGDARLLSQVRAGSVGLIGWSRVQLLDKSIVGLRAVLALGVLLGAGLVAVAVVLVSIRHGRIPGSARRRRAMARAPVTARVSTGSGANPAPRARRRPGLSAC